MAQAFALRNELQGTITWTDDDGDHEREKFVGATITLLDGTSVDVGQMLADGDGVIVTDDPEVLVGLQAVDGLKEVPVPDQHPTLLPLEQRSMDSLLALPDARGLDRKPRTKAELVARIQLAQAGQDPNQPMAEQDGAWVPAPATESTEDQS